jgi:hypothetical protein
VTKAKFNKASDAKEPGPKGDPGKQGLTGARGAKGADGRDGADGPRGVDGLRGRVGPKGDTGDVGADGKQGLTGTRGAPGQDGWDGQNGVDGKDGLDGERGEKGDPGQDGEQGLGGSRGAPGQDGTNGVDGTDGQGGDKGDTGEAGPQGKAGAKGAKGVKGTKGDDGPQGKQGEEGEQGPRGWTGGGGGGGFVSGGNGDGGIALDGEPNGFADRTDVTLAWDEGTRTLTLAGTYSIYSDGTSYDKTGGTFQISDDEGAHFIYYDADGDLQELTEFDISVITRYCFVAEIYWDTVNNTAIPWVVNELHGASMSPDTHEYLHNTVGAAYVSGLGLAGLTTSNNPTGADDNQCQFTAEGGEIRDEDIPQGIQLRSSLTNTIPVLWREGTEASPVWRMDDTRSFPVTNQGTVNDRVMWNELTGGSWQLTEVSANNQFVLAHVYAIPGLNPSTGNLVALVGQGEYANVATARDAAQEESQSLALDGLPSLEFVLVATLIVKTNATWSNTPKAGFVTVDATGSDYVDWREAPRTAGAGSSGHIHVPQSATLARDASGNVESVSIVGGATWTISRNANLSVASLTDTVYLVEVDRDGSGIVTGVTATEL